MKKIAQMFLCIPAIAIKIAVLITLLIMTPLLIIGCSTQYEFSQKTLYDNQPHLQFPAGLEAKTQDYYPIPVTEFDSIGTTSLIPPGSKIGELSVKKK